MKRDDWRIFPYLCCTAVEFRVYIENWTRRIVPISILALYTRRDSGWISSLLVPSYICAIHAGRTRYACGNHVERQVSRFRNCANSDRDYITCRTCDPKDRRTEGDRSGPCVLSGTPYCGSSPYCAHMRRYAYVGMRVLHVHTQTTHG